jgi:tetratricopeptide (TPR) repeat protein
MNFLRNLLGSLAFRAEAIRALAEEHAVLRGFFSFILGFLGFALVRSNVYAPLQPNFDGVSLFTSFLQLNLIQALVFFSLVYVPAVIVLGNSLAGDGFGFYVSREEYRSHVSALFPLWGILLLVAAPLQWLVPEFLILGGGLFGISVGLLVLLILMAVYSVWAIRQLNYLSLATGIAVFVLSWFTLPVFYLLTSFLLALPLIILIPVLYLVLQRAHTFAGSRQGERNLQHHLHILTLNPQDADAHHQLGLIHLKRRNLDAAQKAFSAALKIDPKDPDYHYFLGRVFELKGDWPQALSCYEETYRLNPEYGLGDIFREVGKGYLNTGRFEKAMEFLQFFLETRGSDPEGRYWLAVAHLKTGDLEGMKGQLKTVLEQARSNPRFFRKENREWLYRSRTLLRQH